VLHALLTGPSPEPAKRAPRAPATLLALCRRCLAKDPAARPGSAAEVARALDRTVAPPAPAARAVPLAAAIGLVGAAAAAAILASRGPGSPAGPTAVDSGAGDAALADRGAPRADGAPPSPTPTASALDAAAGRARLQRAGALVADAPDEALRLTAPIERFAGPALRSEAHVIRGLALARRDERSAALAEIDEALLLVPDHLGALRARARLLTQVGRFDESAFTWSRVRALRGGALDGDRVAFAEALLRAGDPGRAAALLSEELAARPEDVAARLLRGRARERLNRLEEASADYEAVGLGDDPDLARRARRGLDRSGVLSDCLAVVVRRSQDYDPTEVLAALEGVLADVPGHELALSIAAWCRYRLGEDAEALAILDAVIARCPRSSDASLWRAQVRGRLANGLGMYADVARAFRTESLEAGALASLPATVGPDRAGQVRDLFAWALRRDECPPELAERLSAKLERLPKPAWPSPSSELHEVLEADQLQDRLRSRPTWAAGWGRLAWLQLAGGDLRGALTSAENGLAFDPDVAEARAVRGVALEALAPGDPRAARLAVGDLEAALRAASPLPDALRARARATLSRAVSLLGGPGALRLFDDLLQAGSPAGR